MLSYLNKKEAIMHVKCPRCDGMGEHNGFQCALCGGRGHVEEEKAKNYTKIVLFGESIPFWNQNNHRRDEE
jgi:hypothetical protein